VKLVASAITIGSGGSGGREGPAAQISATFGSVLATWLGLSAQDRRIAVAAGMGAGIGAIFRAPLGGAVMAAETGCHREQPGAADRLHRGRALTERARGNVAGDRAEEEIGGQPDGTDEDDRAKARDEADGRAQHEPLGKITGPLEPLAFGNDRLQQPGKSLPAGGPVRRRLPLRWRRALNRLGGGGARPLSGVYTALSAAPDAGRRRPLPLTPR
jgi:hypothetical protein